MYAKKFVGQDEYGNRYYQRGRKRFVEFKSKDSLVAAPMWHAWLHHSMTAVPQDIPKYPWQNNYSKEILSFKKRESYESWNPN